MAIEYVGVDRVTKEVTPIIEHLPIVTPFKIVTLVPNQQPSSIIML